MEISNGGYFGSYAEDALIFNKTFTTRFKFRPVKLKNGTWVCCTMISTRREPYSCEEALVPRIVFKSEYYTPEEATALTLAGT